MNSRRESYVKVAVRSIAQDVITGRVTQLICFIDEMF